MTDPEVVLDELERDVRQRMASLTASFDQIVAASRDSNADDEHDPEGATIAYERQQVAALSDAAETQLAEIAAARERLQAGTYGVCESCGDAIAPGRLEARPTARLCIDCAARAGR
ncbi:TraR/DksA family transcriptional regulator [Epidermidibacterium keratini]|uniref:TraR/DksA family transcriptional regulator n=1 Tax=Epidermidibacterium keratini TaxID=1891644 RepID=A0A7L4YQK8_9ACTN|nr:TraR/DksA C4-type zinc finger protein [Epidermidibacterium keratini]QHC01535.1 TraR/DksA family transcriptional regulator [Epidermidibacterium keratini]